MVVNRDKVGEPLGLNFDDPSSGDIFAAGDCDEVFLAMAKELDWLQDLSLYKEQMAPNSQKLLTIALKEK